MVKILPNYIEYYISGMCGYLLGNEIKYYRVLVSVGTVEYSSISNKRAAHFILF